MSKAAPKTMPKKPKKTKGSTLAERLDQVESGEISPLDAANLEVKKLQRSVARAKKQVESRQALLDKFIGMDGQRRSSRSGELFFVGAV